MSTFLENQNWRYATKKYDASKKITTEDLDLFDYIFCMDSQNLSDVKAMAKNEIQRSKIYMLMPDGSNVPDPYYGGVEGFENVFTMVDKACTERVIRLLKKQ
jgi:protein-tyrosine phosphatase